MLLSLLAFAIPALDKPIDFRPDVATVPNLVAKLAKQSGLRLTTGKTVTNDVVAVVAPQNSPREIMDQIAYAIEAEWKESDGEWTLSRSDTVVKDQEKRDKEITAKEIGDAIAKIPDPKPWTVESLSAFALQVEGYQRQPAASQTPAAYRKLQDSLPGNRLLIRFLKKTSPEIFAGVPFAGRVVFSTSPTSMQRPMPSSLDVDLREYFAESRALANAWIEPAKSPYAPIFPRPSIHEVTKVHVIVKRSSLEGLSVTMVAYNPAGNTAFRASKEIGNELSEILTSERIDEGDTPIELRPLSKSLMTLALASISGQSLSPSPELKAVFNRPKENDPLALVNTEAMQALASHGGKPLVAAIGESQLYAAIRMAPDGKLTLNRYLQSLAAIKASREEKDGWICFREHNPALGRFRRVDRASLDQYYRRIERERRAGLDAFAELVLKHPTPLEASLFPIHLMIAGSPKANYTYADDLSIVRFYGLLSPEQREALRSGRDIPFASFSPQQAGILTNFYYNMRHHSFTNEWPNAADGSRLLPDRTGEILGEPTEAYPKGLGAPFSVSAQVIDFPAVFRIMLSGEARSNTPVTLAWERFQQQRPDIFPWASQVGQEANRGYVEGQVIRWEFKFRVSPWLSFTTRLSDDVVPTGPAKKFADLPQSFRDQVAENLARMEREHRDFRIENGGVRRPPPPY